VLFAFLAVVFRIQKYGVGAAELTYLQVRSFVAPRHICLKALSRASSRSVGSSYI